jgi:hypothetical protein
MPGKDFPTIKWGTYREKDTGIAHVAPTIDGVFMKPHTLSENCQCLPTVEKTEYILIVIHHVIH